MAGLQVLGNLFFWVVFSEILKHEVQDISGKVQWLKKAMLAYGKTMPKNNQFSVLCPELIKHCPEKVKHYPEKNLAKIKKFLTRNKILPITCSQANVNISQIDWNNKHIRVQLSVRNDMKDIL